MKRLEPVLEKMHPDLVLVVGDVNSTMAAALVAAKLHLPVAHVEAGLRSFDRTMPEEINRLVTDVIADYLFVSEESGQQNLLREGVDRNKIFFVGNVMIDSLEACRPLWQHSDIYSRLGLREGDYGVVTLHRPANVDDSETLRGLVKALMEISARLPLIFPMHPRTLTRIKEFNLGEYFTYLTQDSGLRTQDSGLCCLDPLGYQDFMSLMAHARLVLTDSGGVQEETTVLGIPCLTLRENTERPVTVTHGTNRLVGMIPARIVEEVYKLLANPKPNPTPPPLWDGRASERIVTILREHYPF